MTKQMCGINSNSGTEKDDDMQNKGLCVKLLLLKGTSLAMERMPLKFIPSWESGLYYSVLYRNPALSGH